MEFSKRLIFCRNSHTLLFPIIVMYIISIWEQNGPELERKISTLSVINMISLSFYDLTKDIPTFQKSYQAHKKVTHYNETKQKIKTDSGETQKLELPHRDF